MAKYDWLFVSRSPYGDAYAFTAPDGGERVSILGLEEESESNHERCWDDGDDDAVTSWLDSLDADCTIDIRWPSPDPAWFHRWNLDDGRREGAADAAEGPEPEGDGNDWWDDPSDVGPY